jgi:hypothetical protein
VRSDRSALTAQIDGEQEKVAMASFGSGMWNLKVGQSNLAAGIWEGGTLNAQRHSLSHRDIFPGKNITPFS